MRHESDGGAEEEHEARLALPEKSSVFAAFGVAKRRPIAKGANALHGASEGAT